MVKKTQALMHFWFFIKTIKRSETFGFFNKSMDFPDFQ